MTTLLASSTTAGASYVWARAKRQRSRRRALARRFADNHVETPLETGHLSPKLAKVTETARMVRLVLETPLHRLDMGLLDESPWLARERIEAYDAALCEARMAVWQWLEMLRQLDVADVTLLRQLQLDPRPLRSLIYRPGLFERPSEVFDSPLFPTIPDPEGVMRAFGEAMDALRRFEEALLSHRPDPYR